LLRNFDFLSQGLVEVSPKTPTTNPMFGNVMAKKELKTELNAYV
jgi:hypothetical protein